MRDRIVHMAVLLGALLACKSGSGGSSSRGSNSTEAPAGPAVSVQATTLFTHYQANEVSADDKYKDKRLKVTGKIQSIDKDAFDNIVIRLASGTNRFMSVMATVQDSEKSKAAALSKGTSATVDCTGGGMIVGSPVLRNCTLQ